MKSGGIAANHDEVNAALRKRLESSLKIDHRSLIIDQGEPPLDATPPRISMRLPFRGPAPPGCASGCVNSASGPRHTSWQLPFCCPAAGSAPTHTAVHVLRGS